MLAVPIVTDEPPSPVNVSLPAWRFELARERFCSTSGIDSVISLMSGYNQYRLLIWQIYHPRQGYTMHSRPLHGHPLHDDPLNGHRHRNHPLHSHPQYGRPLYGYHHLGIHLL